jgi:hypothetical protein
LGKKAIVKITVSQMDAMPALRKCGYCRGKDGKEKDIYETIQDAIDAAKFIEKEREIFLNPYPCPQGNGWHLTKNNADSEIAERQIAIFQNNDIPLKSTGSINWEYIMPENGSRENMAAENHGSKPRPREDKPIIRIEGQKDQNIKIKGKVMEIVENINVEKLFQINAENVFAFNSLKPNLTGDINQITVYVENNSKTESYTLLVQKDLFKKHNIKRGAAIEITLAGKTVNNITKWVFAKM